VAATPDIPQAKAHGQANDRLAVGRRFANKSGVDPETVRKYLRQDRNSVSEIGSEDFALPARLGAGRGADWLGEIERVICYDRAQSILGIHR
jgi:hypothetical protein